ncbi:SGNH/GDSL hydrolase family protein, partial [Rhodobacterales bacterium HKCCE4037]|nr:SGNH/GDSL hydrolase family protein [Rhodobacterales bacterium HKCCE4037]
GVGAGTQDEALAGLVSTGLAEGRAVSWRLVARSGAVVPDVLEMLESVEGRYDCALICLGVNDAKNGRTQPKFERDYAALLTVLSERFGVRRIVCSGLPPKKFYVLLPSPLRDVLGARMTRFDRVIERLAAGHRGARYLPMNFTDDVSLMAPDGFHPGPALYALWAERAAALMREA